MPITLGLEEELQIVDATGALVTHDLALGKLQYPDQNGTSSGEIHRCVLEVQTPVCANVDSLLASLSGLRQIARLRAQAQGHATLSAGLHPFSSWQEQSLCEDSVQFPHYARLLNEYGDVARGAMSFGLHLHFGLDSPQFRMPVMNRLREVLPEALALSASAPFFEGRDTGLQSWRHALLDRYPRMGVPQTWASEAEYTAHIERLRKLGVLSSDQGMWEDIRIHPKFGTIEVRICDATPSLDRVWLITALLLCEVETLVAELKLNVAKAPLSATCIAENRWRARRHGLQTNWIDWHTDSVISTPARLYAWMLRLVPAAERLGLLPRLPAALAEVLTSGTSAQVQREIFQSASSFEAVVSHLVHQTAMPLSTKLIKESH